jgi:hypothetical protein
VTTTLIGSPTDGRGKPFTCGWMAGRVADRQR